MPVTIEQVLERADRVERNGEGWRAAVRYTRERGAQPHDPPGNRLIVFKRPRSVAASISRPRRPAAWCTESARARPRPRAHHRCEFKRDETMHVKARKRGGRTLYARMQESLRDWLALGVTKTRVVYGLGKTAPRYHE